MHPPGADVAVIRYGDLTTKSRSVRRRIRGDLEDHLHELLAARSLPGEVDLRRGRGYVETDEANVEAVARAAADAFGVVSASPALACPPEREAIEDALAGAAAECYDGGTYAVRVQRADKAFPLTSQELERVGGAAVAEGAPDGVEPDVDLEEPDLTFEVDVRSERAFVFVERVDGPGGLPLGSQAPLVALISGGIDSPVAAYEAMSRGSPLIPVYLDLGDYGGPDHEARAVETVRRLAWYAPGRDWDLLRVPAGESVAAIAEELDGGRMIAFRRYTFRVAEHVADEHGAAGIVTGEAIGQKSSQTGANLRATSAATDLPVHRPLLTTDKQVITERAREIGTFRDSTIPAGCNRFAPDAPLTRASLDRARELDPEGLFEWARRDAGRAEAIPVEPAEPER